MMTVRGLLPADTPASVHLALKGITDFENFKRELRTTLQLLKDYGGVSRRSRAAHLVSDLAAHSSALDNSAQPPLGRSGGGEEQSEAGGEQEADLFAMIATMQGVGLDAELILAAVLNFRRGPRQQRRQPPGAKPRVATPP